MAFCPKCGAPVADGAAFCGSCGTSMTGAPSPATQASAGGMESNLAAALAYLWIVAIIFLFLEPYNKDRFIRFHCFQALFLGLGFIVLSIALNLIPFVGWALGSLLWLLYVVAAILTALKAYNQEMYKLPVIGDLAEQQAGR